MNESLLRPFLSVSPEERNILEGGGDIDHSLYSASSPDVINAAKLLEGGKLITMRPHTRFVHFPEHSHDFVELVYMCKGSTHHRVGGEDVVLREGELLFLGQNARQEIFPAGEGDIALNFIILPAFFHETLSLLGTEDTPIKRFLVDSLFRREGAGYLHFRVSNVLPVQNLMENLIWILAEYGAGKQKISQTTMALLFMQLTGFTETLSYGSEEESTLSEIYRYVEENYREGSLSHAANTLHYDPFRLSHLIPRLTGKTFTRLLQEKRLSQAAYLLQNTRLPVEEVCSAVGYENKSYFHRIFAESFGTTPKKYRDGK